VTCRDWPAGIVKSDSGSTSENPSGSPDELETDGVKVRSLAVALVSVNVRSTV
jgi:hypothetical protein